LTRVLFLVESFLPVLGGGEIHIRDLAMFLAGKGVPALVLTRRSRREWAKEERLGDVSVLRVVPSGASALLKYAMLPAAAVALVRERRRYDVIVVRGGRILALPALVIGHALRKAVVLQAEVSGEISGDVYTWGTMLHRSPLRKAVGALARVRNRFLGHADAFVAIASHIRREFVEGGLPESRIELIPHGVDTNRFRPPDAGEKRRLREGLGLPQEARIVVFTGRLLRGKGVEVLLEAFAGLEVPSWRLVIVGSGDGQPLSVEDDLRARAAATDLVGRVIFAGRVDNVDDYLRAADVFAFPSYFEAMPISVLEATACGLPCVATAVGGIPDVIEDGVSGRLVPPGDTAALRSGLRALLTDSAGAAALGQRARARALARFDRDTSFARYLELFTRLAEERRC
jgi:glycosyltransferase involved in cell wall biosynthesis